MIKIRYRKEPRDYEVTGNKTIIRLIIFIWTKIPRCRAMWRSDYTQCFLYKRKA